MIRSTLCKWTGRTGYNKHPPPVTESHQQTRIVLQQNASVRFADHRWHILCVRVHAFNLHEFEALASFLSATHFAAYVRRWTRSWPQSRFSAHAHARTRRKRVRDRLQFINKLHGKGNAIPKQLQHNTTKKHARTHAPNKPPDRLGVHVFFASAHQQQQQQHGWEPLFGQFACTRTRACYMTMECVHATTQKDWVFQCTAHTHTSRTESQVESLGAARPCRPFPIGPIQSTYARTLCALRAIIVVIVLALSPSSSASASLQIVLSVQSSSSS